MKSCLTRRLLFFNVIQCNRPCSKCPSVSSVISVVYLFFSENDKQLLPLFNQTWVIEKNKNYVFLLLLILLDMTEDFMSISSLPCSVGNGGNTLYHFAEISTLLHWRPVCWHLLWHLTLSHSVFLKTETKEYRRRLKNLLQMLQNVGVSHLPTSWSVNFVKFLLCFPSVLKHAFLKIARLYFN